MVLSYRFYSKFYENGANGGKLVTEPLKTPFEPGNKKKLPEISELTPKKQTRKESPPVRR
jgi:hypothetical protein